MSRRRPLPLAVWLTLSSLGLVLLLVVGLVPAGLALFERLADESARSRVQLAAVGALEAARWHADETLTSARLLSERPTLLRLLETGQTDELRAFLERFRETSGLDGCAVLAGDVAVAAAPGAFPWPGIGAHAAAGARYLEPPGGEADAVLLCTVPLAGDGTARVLTLRRLGATFEQALAEQVGLPVRVVTGAAADRDAYASAAGWSAQRVLGRDAAGAVGLEVFLDRSSAAAALAPLRKTYATVTLIACLLAVGAALLAARHLSRPLRELGRAAERIGAGDLATPVPPTGGAETGPLSLAMEEMRRRLRDVTAELRQREAEAQALLHGIVEGVFSVDGERRIRYLSPQAAAQLGVTVEDALGRFCGDVLNPLAKNGVKPCESACPIVHARSRGSSRAVEHLALSGGRRTVVVTSAPPSGATQVQLIRDETEIEAARRSRDAVLANVSHELKTPLSGQLASIELLRGALERADPAAAAELVASLERSTLRLARLINNLLESVRIETGQMTSRRVPVELAAVVADAEALTRPLFDQRRQVLVLELPEPFAQVMGDPVQLSQVLVNLLANANKFAPAGSTVRVGGALAGREIALWVEDAGPGVPPAQSTSVFDRFHRADTSSEGMGLGLWIVKSIVERHGGRVGVSPVRTGGARFIVTLPAGGDA